MVFSVHKGEIIMHFMMYLMKQNSWYNPYDLIQRIKATYVKLGLQSDFFKDVV